MPASASAGAGLFTCGIRKGARSRLTLGHACFRPFRISGMVFFHAKEEVKMPTIDMTATGLRIGALRDAAGLTNKDLADALGFSTRNAVCGRWLFR